MTAEEITKKIKILSSEILQGKISIVDGVMELKPLLTDLGIDLDEDFIVIAAVDSDTDIFPIGSARKYWNPDKLKELDDQRDDFEKINKEDVFEACRKLIEKFK